MLMRKGKVKHDGSREFRPSFLSRLGTLAAVAFFLFLAMVIARDTVPWYMLVFVVPLFGFIAWFGLMQVTQMTLTVREEGLEYRFGSGTVTTSWANLRRFLYHNTGRTSTMGVELGSGVRQQVDGGKMEKAIFGEEAVHYIPLSDIVPVPTVYDKEKKQARVDLEKFAKTPFGQELLYHAPHLFEESAVLKSKS